MSPEQPRLVTGTGLWSRWPAAAASCDDAGESYDWIAKDCGRRDMEPLLSSTFVARGCSWTHWSHGSRTSFWSALICWQRRGGRRACGDRDAWRPSAYAEAQRWTRDPCGPRVQSYSPRIPHGKVSQCRSTVIRPCQGAIIG